MATLTALLIAWIPYQPPRPIRPWIARACSNHETPRRDQERRC